MGLLMESQWEEAHGAKITAGARWKEFRRSGEECGSCWVGNRQSCLISVEEMAEEARCGQGIGMHRESAGSS